MLVLLGMTFARAQVGELADVLIHGTTAEFRQDAATRLGALGPEQETEVAEAVRAQVRWRERQEPRFVGDEGLLPALGLGPESRRGIATELVTWRVQLTLVGTQEIPPRLASELGALLGEEIARYGAPTQTTDWLHLLAAAGGDPQVVLDRLGIGTEHRWKLIVDEVDTLGEPIREMLPLLAHRSPIVRERAAERLEREPAAAIAALSRAYRWAPGRMAPLRGEVAPPELERTVPGAERWARKLVRWARRSSRQNDDSALLATLWLIAEPSTTTVLTDAARYRTADGLLKVARRDEGSVPRVTHLLQAMDAVLRGVPFPEGEHPAPEEVQAGKETWVRAVPPR